jgi:inosose dehydratase
MNIKIGNAPCSWGTLEFEGMGPTIPYGQMLDELKESGYQGTELGDWGYFPTDSSKLADELLRRELDLLGAFVPVGLKYSQNLESGLQTAIKISSLQKEVALKIKSSTAPFLILSDNNGSEKLRTDYAGKITSDMGLTGLEWKIFGLNTNLIAKEVFEKTGLKTVFHHHCAGYVETPKEIDRFLENTDSKYVGLVLDTGHYSYGRNLNDPTLIEALDRYKERLWYIHFKDFKPISGALDYFQAVRAGVFCELGKGEVNFPQVLNWLKENNYQGYALVEQDILPGMGKPFESALKNRNYLKSIGL